MIKRIFFVGLSIVLITGLFWTQSRYPSLNEKAGGDFVMEDSLSFETILPIKESFPFYKKIIFSTLGHYPLINIRRETIDVLCLTSYVNY